MARSHIYAAKSAHARLRRALIYIRKTRGSRHESIDKVRAFQNGRRGRALANESQKPAVQYNRVCRLHVDRARYLVKYFISLIIVIC